MNSKKPLLVLVLMLALSYQNFMPANEHLTSINFAAIDHSVRVDHAKELMGRAYFGSTIQRAENVKNMQWALHKMVHLNLPEKYKGKSVDLMRAILVAAKANDMDPVFIMAVIKTESMFNPEARGTHGEIGLMQVKPDTAKWIALKEGLPWHGPKTLLNPALNVRIGTAYFAHLRDQSEGYANKYVSAYNMGLAKVRKMYKASVRPHEYSLRVMRNYKEFYAQIVANDNKTILAKNFL